MKMSLAEISKYSIIPVLLPSVFTGFFPNKIVAVQALCYYLILYILWLKRKQWHKEEFDGSLIFTILFVYSSITYFRGFFNIDWRPDWINQFSGLLYLCVLFPFLLFLPNTYNLNNIFRGFLIYGLVLCSLTAVLPPSDEQMSFQHNMYFLCGFLFCTPYIKRKYSIIIWIGLIIAVLYNLDRRSIFITISAAVFIYVYYKYVKNRLLRKMLPYSFIISPIIFLLLGVTGVYNIFSAVSDSDSIDTQDEGRAINVDSRSSIYLDVLLELQRQDAFLFGLGGNGKTQTSLTDSPSNDFEDIYKYGRPGTESGMLNNIQYGGVIGLTVFSLLYIIGAYRASFHSRNEYMRMLGTFVAFKFLYSFVEDKIAAQASAVYLFIWIGMCYNVKFRNMNDNEIKTYFSKIFK